MEQDHFVAVIDSIWGLHLLNFEPGLDRTAALAKLKEETIGLECVEEFRAGGRLYDTGYGPNTVKAAWIDHVTERIHAPMDDWYAEAKARKHSLRQEINAQAERAEYERLKAKYGK